MRKHHFLVGVDPGDQNDLPQQRKEETFDPTQASLFDEGDPLPPVHSDGHDTEFAARDQIAKGASKWRKNVFDFVASAGERGVIPWEAIVHFDQQNHQSTVRTRFTELASEAHGAVLTRTASKRPNANGNMEGVYIVSRASRDAPPLQSTTKKENI
jgi:hypothetical protein